MSRKYLNLHVPLKTARPDVLALRMFPVGQFSPRMVLLSAQDGLPCGTVLPIK